MADLTEHALLGRQQCSSLICTERSYRCSPAWRARSPRAFVAGRRAVDLSDGPASRGRCEVRDSSPPAAAPATGTPLHWSAKRSPLRLPITPRWSAMPACRSHFALDADHTLGKQSVIHGFSRSQANASWVDGKAAAIERFVFVGGRDTGPHPISCWRDGSDRISPPAWLRNIPASADVGVPVRAGASAADRLAWLK